MNNLFNSKAFGKGLETFGVKNVLHEIESLSRISGSRIVQYMKSYIDYNNTVFIQMEFCCDNLYNILKTRNDVFDRTSDEVIDRIEYFICSQIFIELLEAVKSIHEYKPSPVMHRDIKPENMLFTSTGTQTGIFFKLCDFGLAKFVNDQDDEENGRSQTKNTKSEIIDDGNLDVNGHDRSHTRMVGTPRYMAPEVKLSRYYDHKSDVYSLGIVAADMFELYEVSW